MVTLSLCVICKNEEKNIGTLLDSVKGELFDEIIVVDTGSTDGTLDILKHHKVKIDHFKWVDDFSAARNYSFSKATSSHLMWLDSDDYLKPEDYQKLLELKPKLHEHPMWLLKYEYAHDEMGRSTCSFYRERIVARYYNVKWQEPIHEYIPLIFPYKKVDIEIQHNRKEAHTLRNISILESIVATKPNFSRNVYYLGKEYFDNGDYTKGISLLEKFLDMDEAWDENKYNALIRLAEHQISQNMYDRAREYLHKAIQIDALKAKAYYYLGDISLSLNDYNTAIHWLNICQRMGRSEQSLDVVEPKYHTWLPNLQLCLAYNHIGNLEAAAEANERALAFRPEDTRMLNNKAIFVKALSERYPFHNDETLESYNLRNSPLPEFKRKIGWVTSSEKSFASTRIRMQNISETLYRMGYSSEYFSYTNEDEYDFIITGHLYHQAHLEQIHIWKSKGITVISDVNEDILQFPLVKETLLASDYIVCCSNSLALYISNTLEVTNVSVIEDAVEYFAGGSDDV